CLSIDFENSSMLGRKKDFQKYFWPKMIAIGPLHCDDPDLQKAKKLKHKLVAYFIKEHDLEKEMLYNKIKMEIGNLKKCYNSKEMEQYYMMMMRSSAGCSFWMVVHFYK
ncbi:hypothetical protein CCACVL1_02189, partial [Corchorus capsularis]